MKSIYNIRIFSNKKQEIRLLKVSGLSFFVYICILVKWNKKYCDLKIDTSLNTTISLRELRIYFLYILTVLMLDFISKADRDEAKKMKPLTFTREYKMEIQ